MHVTREGREGEGAEEATPGVRPTLDYQPPRPGFVLPRPTRRFLVALVLWAAFLCYEPARRWWGTRLQAQYVARVAPTVEGDPRFRWVFVRGTTAYITRDICPVGVVETPAELEALRAVLQAGDPPYPLNLRFVTVNNPAPVTRPAIDPSDQP